MPADARGAATDVPQANPCRVAHFDLVPRPAGRSAGGPLRGVLLVLALLLVATFAGCVDEGSDGADGSGTGTCDTNEVEPVESGLFAIFDTSEGCFIAELFPEDAPVTVDNFVEYAEDDFYRGTIFHRIMPNFVVQGGGFTADGQQKQTREPIPLEAKRSNVQWTLSMARTPDPNSATSQFYVNVVDNSNQLDPSANPPGYAVFGKVVAGFDTIEGIRQTETGTGPQGQADWPRDPPPAINDVRIDDSRYDPPEPTYGLEAAPIPRSVAGEDAGYATNISAETDHLAFWIVNQGNQPDTFTVDLHFPSRWDVSMQPSRISLAAGGREDRDAGQAVLLTIEALDPDAIKANAEDGNHDTLRVAVRSDGDPDAQATFDVELRLGDGGMDRRVSGPGSRVNVDYAGSFDDGTEFDSGTFPTTLGSGQTVPGFDLGLMGLAVGEPATLYFPPELGYGYDHRDPRFNGEWLTFDVTLTSIQ